jgi:hypothetical protein
VDFRVSPMGWQRVRLERRQVGATSTPGRSLGSASLGSSSGRLCHGGRALAIGPRRHQLHMPVEEIAGMWISAN